ncbi:metalloproteinase inhibitor 1-like [Pleurodeles waltl]|uniref:metalloproteinase inhibitor 1-like n=1 Tax=Pleurodeles waltl TaxID=8319 RepID=UPI003709BFF8
MDANIRLWLVMAFMSISAYPCIDCCSCFWPHPQKTFCNSDVVMHAEFLGATFTDATDEFYGDYQVITYEIEIVQVFKGSAEIQNLKFIYTSTLYYCEYYVSQSNYNKKYLITGNMMNGRLEVIHCNYIVLWSQLPEAQKSGFEGAYNCDCKICYPSECSKDTSSYCTLNWGGDWNPLDSEYSDREEKEQTCERNENGHCTWQPDDTLLSTLSTTLLETTVV